MDYEERWTTNVEGLGLEELRQPATVAVSAESPDCVQCRMVRSAQLLLLTRHRPGEDTRAAGYKTSIWGTLG